MHKETAKKLLKMYREFNPHRHDFGTAIDTILAELERLEEVEWRMEGLEK